MKIKNSIVRILKFNTEVHTSRRGQSQKFRIRFLNSRKNFTILYLFFQLVKHTL